MGLAPKALMSETFTEHIRAVNASQFAELVGVYQDIEAYCKRDFPECEFRFEFNSDNINKELNVKTTILTSNELDPSNRLLKTTVLTITEQMWYNTALINSILKTLFHAQTQWIARIINDHYEESKRKRGIV